MSINALSSSAPLSKPNKFKYNGGAEFNTDFSFNTYETMFRGYDPQLGRFMQLDPLADFMPGINPYQYAFNNPILYNDPFGLSPEDRMRRRNKRANRKARRTAKAGANSNRRMRLLWRIAKLRKHIPDKSSGPKPSEGPTNNRTFDVSTQPKREPFDIAPISPPGLQSGFNPSFGVPGPPTFNYPTLPSVTFNSGPVPVEIPPGSRATFRRSIFFESNSANIRDMSQASGFINELRDVMMANRYVNVLILGNIGVSKWAVENNGVIVGNSQEAHDQKRFYLDGVLSQAKQLMNSRAEAVRQALMGLGIDPNRIQIGPGSVIMRDPKKGNDGRKVNFIIKNGGG